MEKTVKITIKNIDVSPYKVRLVANLIRGARLDRAIDIVGLLNKKAAIHVKKALVSAGASAKDILNADLKDLYIKSITADEGAKRLKAQFESRGRVSRLTNRKSHINLEVAKK